MRRILFTIMVCFAVSGHANAQQLDAVTNMAQFDGYIGLAGGFDAVGDGLFCLVKYVAASTKTHDGKRVFNPDNRVGPGRFEYITNRAIDLTTTEVSGATYTILNSDFNGNVNANNTGARTFTLTSKSNVAEGFRVSIKDKSGTASPVSPITVNTNGTDLIDGQTSVIINCAYCEISICRDANNYTVK